MPGFYTDLATSIAGQASPNSIATNLVDGGIYSILGQSLHSDFDARYGITLNGSNVSSWANRGVDTAAAVQVTAGKQPAYGAAAFSGGPGITGDGADDELIATLATPLAVLTRPYAWIVGKWVTFPGVSIDIALGIQDAAITSLIWYGTTTANLRFQRFDTSGNGADFSLAQHTNAQLVEMGLTAGGTAAFVQDGSAINSTTTGTPVNPLNKVIVLSASGANYANYIVARVIVATGVTAAQVTAMRAYLRGANFPGYANNSYGTP